MRGQSVAWVMVLLLLLSGCLGGPGDTGVNETEPNATSPNDTTTMSDDDDENTTELAEDRPFDDSNGSSGGQGAPGTSTEDVPDVEGGAMSGRAGTLELGNITPDMNESRYLPGNDTIRYVEFWFASPSDSDLNGSSEPEPHYAFVAFEDWSERTCAETAARRAGAVARNRTEVDDLDWGVGRENGTLRSLVRVTTLVDRSGQVTATPGVTLEELAAATPRSVTMTLRLGERTQRCEKTITVEHSVQRAL